MNYIITSSLCIMVMGASAWTVFFTTSPVDMRKDVICTPIPTYRISDSSVTVPGETVYQVMGK